MLGAVAGRERRALWGTLALLLALGIGISLLRAQAARKEAADEAGAQARLTAQTSLSPLLTTKDLEGPITGERYGELTAAIERDITLNGPITQVTIWSSLGRNLYDAEPAQVGTRSSYLRELIFEVATGDPQSSVANGTLRTFTSLFLEPGGTVVVAEMDQPFGPIAAEANAPWYRLALGLGIGLLLTAALFAVTFLPKARTRPKSVTYQPSRPRPASEPTPPDYMQPGFRELEQARQEAEDRAAAIEKDYRGLQAQFKGTLEELKVAEAKLTERESTAPPADDDVVVLRAHLRDATQRLSEAEEDRQALRERLALRQQELEAALALIRELEGQPEKVRRAFESEDAEIDTIQSRLHLKKLGEAFRDRDESLVVSDPDVEIAERPVIYPEPADEQNDLPASGKRGAR
jgi:hypothetical protein